VWGWLSTGGKWVKKATNGVVRPLSDAAGKVAYRAIQTTKGGYRFVKVAVGSFSYATLTTLKAVKPADKTLTNLSRQIVDQMGHRIKPVAQSLKSKIDDIVLHGDANGLKTEELCHELFETNGFVKKEAKFGSNNGFDGVYIKMNGSNVQEIIINEAKQVGSAGNIKLNPRNDNTGLQAQMSDGWISDVIGKMKLQGGDLATLSDVLNANKSKITKTVTGVDKASSEIVILKLTNY